MAKEATAVAQRFSGDGAMFDRIAARYDLLNRVISLGLDHHWRKRLVRALTCRGTDRILDVATGTADVPLAVCAKYAKVHVTGLDPSGRMLAIGQAKLRAAGFADRVTLVAGDAQALPFGDKTFDASCVSFGIRNVPDRLRGLREMVRVTKPGRRVAVLELNEPTGGMLTPVTRFHLHRVVPRLGALVSGESEYRYLAESVAAFPSVDVFVGMMRDAGLIDVTASRLSFGVVHLFVGTVA